ncbi:uncharacterized protein RSE6_00652 [Rhynchosporium secalis]|uniref:Uncharacterized protein n=1 Tax=Rhynchosporium secalis TaxID=38038 RepID=A0A1E1LXI3_RHYSE|nr:uncharacterized protein RSE6_00652 [Rhynchosporium secalis]
MSFDTWVIAMLGLKHLEAFKGGVAITHLLLFKQVIQDQCGISETYLQVRQSCTVNSVHMSRIFRWYSQAIAVRTSYIKHAREHMADVRSI